MVSCQSKDNNSNTTDKYHALLTRVVLGVEGKGAGCMYVSNDIKNCKKDSYCPRHHAFESECTSTVTTPGYLEQLAFRSNKNLSSLRCCLAYPVKRPILLIIVVLVSILTLFVVVKNSLSDRNSLKCLMETDGLDLNQCTVNQGIGRGQSRRQDDRVISLNELRANSKEEDLMRSPKEYNSTRTARGQANYRQAYHNTQTSLLDTSEISLEQAQVIDVVIKNTLPIKNYSSVLRGAVNENEASLVNHSITTKNKNHLMQHIKTSPSYAIKIDKIRGIDFPSSLLDEMGQTISNNSCKQARVCKKNKFDQLIAQKIEKNELSRPIKSNGLYDNPWDTWPGQKSLVDALQFVVTESNNISLPKTVDELDKILPILKPDFEIYESQDKQDFRVTWIGHSTILIQIDGYNILTDPVFSERASPVQFFGPKRYRRPACKIEDLPPIDAVLISHNHFDHLDANSVQELNNRFGSACRWIAPLGLGNYFDSMSVKNYVELDWWQKDCLHCDKLTNMSDKSITKETDRGELSIYLTPAQHWSRRGLMDTNKSLWGSFTIASRNDSTFFFNGDTGLCSTYEEIGEIFGPFTGAAIPIGAYNPRWFLKQAHVDPAEAIKIHRSLRSGKSIGIHHSTFPLSYEPFYEPPKLLMELMGKFKANGTVEGSFITLRHGESTVFKKLIASS